MIINIEFTTARGYKYETMRTEFDRNYLDEEQALIFIESEEDDFNGYFEVNIRKDEQGKAISEGYVCEYASTEDSDPQTIYEDAKIEVKLHDFDDVVELANTELMQDGLQIVLEYDGECYWSIGTQIKATKEIKWFVSADFEDEVRGHIYECWAHARALAKEMVKGDEKPAKVWVMTQESCVDGEVHFNVVVCDSEETAKAQMQKEIDWIKNDSFHFRDFEERGDDFEVEQGEHRFFINDETDDYYEEIMVMEKEITTL